MEHERAPDAAIVSAVKMARMCGLFPADEIDRGVTQSIVNNVQSQVKASVAPA